MILITGSKGYIGSHLKLENFIDVRKENHFLQVVDEFSIDLNINSMI